jgi:hypothetical protein
MSSGKFNVKIEGGSGSIFMGDNANVNISGGSGRGGMLNISYFQVNTKILIPNSSKLFAYVANLSLIDTLHFPFRRNRMLLFCYYRNGLIYLFKTTFREYQGLIFLQISIA